MKQFSSLTNDAKQKTAITLDDGTLVSVTLEYRDNQRGWFYSLNYGATGFVINNRRLVVSPNMLRAFRNIIPFGFACISAGGSEPVFLNDFVSGRVGLYILESSDIPVAEAVING